ncbi:MAG TPA: hypothetical protein PLL30_03010 [Candidatus Krumholzibacteria bacterium]|nr:hypothetical protein [Candidatus Krumholzibacteria bacterium]HPD70741.1 hypothetical protein [Candidatus Krumholzibacteria bacterium]HRY39559.1 hypothetical protein [Candidatus Krumholzibacteria bacterium]
MRAAALYLVLLALAWPLAAHDLGVTRPAKPAVPNTPPSPDRDVLRQGGDTIADAVAVTIPATFDGTTTGYTNDYDEVCPYAGSTSPDVVYTFTPDDDFGITVDTFGSELDTKIYIYDSDLALVACNDDFYYGDYTSRLENVPVFGGVQYFLVIDGWGGDHGIYTGYVEEFVPCVLECPAGAALEGEPPIVDGYVDHWNGGCNTPPDYPFQDITSPIFCGKSGYYLNASGQSSRDTDWFHVIIPESGELEITGDAEERSYIVEIGPQYCGLGVIQVVSTLPCSPTTMSITWSGPGSLVWIWVGSQTFWDGATYEYDYVLFLNLTTPVEPHSWTAVKRLFN